MAWRPGQAYSDDLRQRVLAAVDGGMPVYRAAGLFDVSVSYIYKALIRRRRTGEVSARAQRSHQVRKLVPLQGALRAKVEAQPDATLRELQTFLRVEHGTYAAIASIALELKALGFTRKKSRSGRPSRPDRTSPGRAAAGTAGSAGWIRTASSSSTRWGPAPS